MTREFTVQLTDNRRKPNILFVLLDDIGLELPLTQLAARHAEMGVAGANLPQVTQLQAWADEGVVFDNVWTASRCSPTRSHTLTGRYSFRTGIGIVVREDELPTPSLVTSGELGTLGSEFTLPKLLKDYDTCHLGKYHLALSSDTTDGLGGTDVAHALSFAGWGNFRGILANPYNRIGGLEIGLPPQSGATLPGYWNYYWHDTLDNDGSTEPTQVVGTHLTQRTRAKSYAWMRQAREPWCGYLWFNAAHTPYGDKDDNGNGASGIEPPAGQTYNTYSNIDTDNWDAYRAGIENLDYQLATLASQMGSDLLSRTLIVVMGDNGIPGGSVLSSMQAAESLSSPYSVLTTDRVKSSPYNAGLRNFIIARGPSRYVGGTPGRTSSVPIDAVDIFETLRHVARAAPSGVTTDGRTFLPAMVHEDNEAYHERDFHFAEQFSPNGNPTTLSQGGVTTQQGSFADADHEWLRSYQMDVGGTQYKIIEGFNESGAAVAEFYDIDADPYELSDLGTGHANYATVKAAMDALLAS